MADAKDMVFKARCPLHPDMEIKVSLYTQVQNAPEIRKNILEGKIHATLIKPALVVDLFQILTATNKAICAHKNNKKITKTLYSEVLFSFSASKNITESFRKYGIDDKDKSLVVIEVTEDGASSSADDIRTVIDGTQVPVSKIPDLTDIQLVKKVYKVKDEELASCSLSDSVVSRIACKDVLSV